MKTIHPQRGGPTPYRFLEALTEILVPMTLRFSLPPTGKSTVGTHIVLVDGYLVNKNDPRDGYGYFYAGAWLGDQC